MITIREERFDLEDQILRLLRQDKQSIINNKKIKLLQMLEYMRTCGSYHRLTHHNIHSSLSIFKHTVKENDIYRFSVHHNKNTICLFEVMIVLDENINEYIVLIRDIFDSTFTTISESSAKFGLMFIREAEYYEYDHSMKLYDDISNDLYKEIRWHPIEFNHGHESLDIFLAQLIVDKCNKLGINIYKQYNKEKKIWEYIDFSKESC